VFIRFSRDSSIEQTYVEGIVWIIARLRHQQQMRVSASAVLQLISWDILKLSGHIGLIVHESCGVLLVTDNLAKGRWINHYIPVPGTCSIRLHSSIPNGILAVRVRTTANEEEQRDSSPADGETRRQALSISNIFNRIVIVQGPQLYPN
jgi:hypothetical protein